jgi:hypothetical protein
MCLVAQEFFRLLFEQFKTDKVLKFYFYCGGKEGSGTVNMTNDMNRMADIIEKKSNYNVRRVNNPLGLHNENYWRQEFTGFYKWLMN